LDRIGGTYCLYLQDREDKNTKRRNFIICRHSSLNTVRAIKSRTIILVGHVARMGEMRNLYRILVGKPEGEISLGRRRVRWEDNIKVDIWEIGFRGVDWIHVAQDRDRWWALVNTVMKLWVQKKAEIS
jgi:hypothetical protein